MRSDSSKPQPVRGRSLARARAVQALYQWELNPIDAVKLVAGFFEDPQDEDDEFGNEHSMKKVDADYFQVLVKGCVEKMDELDESFKPFLQIDLSLLDPIERCILRLSTFELKHRIDIPKRVVINEGVELTKDFGAEDGHKFVNGVLDKVANAIRIHE